MSYQHYRSPFGDTTYTKVFVGGLAWETPTDVMKRYFEQFGEILEAVIITDKTTGKSKGYGFVTFRDPESARRACSDPNPMIDGRRANCNIASLGRPRPSPPRGRTQVGNNPYQGSGYLQGSSSSSPSPSSYGGVVVPSPLHPHPPPPLPTPAATAYIYPPYGYATCPTDYAYHQGIYNPHIHHQAQYYHQQLYAAPSPSPSSSSSSPSSSGGMNTPYFYGYSMMQPSSRGASFSPTSPRIQGPPYLYYPSHHQMDQPTTASAGAATATATYYPTPFPLLQPTRQPFVPSSDSQTPRQTPTTTATTTTTAAVTATTTPEADAGTVTSGSPSSA